MVTCDLFIKTAGDDVARKGKRNEKVKSGGRGEESGRTAEEKHTFSLRKHENKQGEGVSSQR